MSDMYIVKNFPQNTSTVPAFLTKLWALVENPANDDLICWDESGNSFHVYDQGRFAKEILPHYFKHSNIASFIRQLNMYGFRKVSRIDHGIKDESDDLEFQHIYFRRGEEHLLHEIKRKITGSSTHLKTEPFLDVQSGGINNVLTEVQIMKERQETVNTKLESMKRENELLWREVASLRQKHSKQQQIVNKLIQFLIHLVRGTGLNLNKKRPLMLSNSSQVTDMPPAKIKKYEMPVYTVQSPERPNSTEGPVISEITDKDIVTENKPPTITETFANNHVDIPSGDLPDINSDILDVLKSFPTDLPTQTPEPISTFTGDPTTDINYLAKFSNGPEKNSSLQQTFKASPPISRQQSIHELNDHIDTLESDLDGLRDVLSNTQYSIDPSFLLGLFNMDPTSIETDNNMINIMDPNNEKEKEEHGNQLNTPGSQLVEYKPTEILPDLFDLATLTKDDEDTLVQTINTPDVELSKFDTHQNLLTDDVD